MNNKFLLTVLLMLLSAGALVAQTIQHPWSVTDGGGGKSSGSGFTLSTSLGQTAAGTMTGTGFILEGGFLPGVRQLSGTTSTLDVQLASAWNLLSVPFISGDMRKSILYPTATSNAFAYGPTGYVAKDTLQNGVGYWLKFASGQTVTLTGTSFAPETIDVSTGWNLIGTVSYPALTADIVALPSASVSSPYFGYTASGYFAEDTLKPGLGYWVKSSGNGKLVVSAAPLIQPEAVISMAAVRKGHTSGKHISSVADVLEGFQSLRVTDARDQERILYFSGIRKDVNLDQFELPPLPPGDILDVRFRSQRITEMPDAEGKSEFPLQVSGAEYPVTFSWDVAPDGGDYALEIRTEKESKQHRISGKGDIVVPDGDFIFIKIRMISQEEPQLPKVFALYQNFPNPFNPSTTIRYDVPKLSKVSLKIYDILGQEVFTLVDQERAAGKYAVELRADELPSGVYYFRLLAGDFSDVKKLLLMK